MKLGLNINSICLNITVQQTKSLPLSDEASSSSKYLTFCVALFALVVAKATDMSSSSSDDSSISIAAAAGFFPPFPFSPATFPPAVAFPATFPPAVAFPTTFLPAVAFPATFPPAVAFPANAYSKTGQVSKHTHTHTQQPLNTKQTFFLAAGATLVFFARATREGGGEGGGEARGEGGGDSSSLSSTSTGS